MRWFLCLAPGLLFACARVELPAPILEESVDAGSASNDLSLGREDDLRQQPSPDLVSTSLPDLDTRENADLTPNNQQKMGSCRVSINEIQTAGNGGATDEFVELFSKCDADVSLDGYQLVYESAAGSTRIPLITFTNVTIPAAKPYLVVGHKSYAGNADQRYSATSMAAAGGSVGLLDANGNLVSSVGWGTATNPLVEKSAAPAPPTAQSIERRPDGQETNDNSVDLVLQAKPTPGAPNQ